MEFTRMGALCHSFNRSHAAHGLHLGLSISREQAETESQGTTAWAKEHMRDEGHSDSCSRLPPGKHSEPDPIRFSR